MEKGKRRVEGEGGGVVRSEGNFEPGGKGVNRKRRKEGQLV